MLQTWHRYLQVNNSFLENVIYSQKLIKNKKKKICGTVTKDKCVYKNSRKSLKCMATERPWAKVQGFSCNLKSKIKVQELKQPKLSCPRQTSMSRWWTVTDFKISFRFSELKLQLQETNKHIGSKRLIFRPDIWRQNPQLHWYAIGFNTARRSHVLLC